MNKSADITELAKALVAAQSELRNPGLDGFNPHFKSKFASLACVREVVTPTLAKHGLVVVQLPGSTERGPTLTNLIMHISGQWIESDAVCFPTVKQDAQAYGAALSYLRRYCLQSVTGVVGDEDDDGQAAVAQPKVQAPAKAAQQAPAKKPIGDRVDGFSNNMVYDGLCAVGDVAVRLVDRMGSEWAKGDEKEIEDHLKAYAIERRRQIIHDLLARKGETWERLGAKLDLPRGQEQVLNRKQFASAKALIEPLPDAPAKAKAS